MMDVYRWSTTASSNNASPPDGWPEGMSRKMVNNTAREMMAAVKAWYDAPEWLNLFYGYTVTRVSDTVARIAGVDGTSILNAGRRVYITNGSTTVYGYVSSATYSSPDTDLAVLLDSGVVPATGTLALHVHAGATLKEGAFLDVGSTTGELMLYEHVRELIATALFEAGAGLYAIPTGTVWPTYRTTAPAGWLLFDDTDIGPTGSGATHAGDDYEDLFTVLWDAVSNPSSNAYCAVSGGLGGSAASDWAAGTKTLALPKMLGRAMAVAGAGASLTSRVLGSHYSNDETVTLTVNQMPVHTHPFAASMSTLSAGGSSTANASGPQNTGPAGGGDPHENMQPTTFLNAMVKL